MVCRFTINTFSQILLEELHYAIRVTKLCNLSHTHTRRRNLYVVTCTLQYCEIPFFAYLSGSECRVDMIPLEPLEQTE